MMKGDNMTRKGRFAAFVPTIILLVLVLFVCACNRSNVRIPGASLPFPETPTGYMAEASYPHRLVVFTPVDQRPEHYGELVAGTKWKSCSTDPFWGSHAPQIIQVRLAKEFQFSNIFSDVSTAPAGPEDLVMRTAIHAFCSHSVGFFYVRVAGITSLHVIIQRNGKILLDRKFEKVVTDVDKEYTGSKAGFLEQAMKVTMADSLREVLKDMLKEIEADAKSW